MDSSGSDDGETSIRRRQRYMREYMRRRRAQQQVQQEEPTQLEEEQPEVDHSSDSSESISSYESSLTSHDDDENVQEVPLTLSERLRVWKASNMSVTQTACTELLQILRDRGHNNLPSDARTLMESPRRVELTNGENGVYHIRDVSSVLAILLKLRLKLSPGSVTLPIQLSSDGVSLFSSSTKEFYPVMLKVNDPRSPPILYAIHFGKRPNANFFRSCLEPLLPFLTLGLDREEGHVEVVLEAVVADLPCRQLLKQIRGHAGYSACEYCHVQAERHERTMVYPGLSILPARTDTEFILKSDEMHHLAQTTSPFVEVCPPCHMYHIIIK